MTSGTIFIYSFKFYKSEYLLNDSTTCKYSVNLGVKTGKWAMTTARKRLKEQSKMKKQGGLAVPQLSILRNSSNAWEQTAI